MEPFKNFLDGKAARRIADAMTRADSDFDAKRFLTKISDALEPLEFKQRTLLLKSRLIDLLPEDPVDCFPLLVAALKKDDADPIGLSGFLVWPLTQIVSERGLDNFDLSMETLRSMTRVFTAEFAVRPFLIRHEARTLELFSVWTRDPDEHVRRLVSEGSRPLLPWGERLPAFVKDPDKTWNLLQSLRHDRARYVQKSVANHINDHAKNHPDWVADKMKNWAREPDAPASLKWIVKHATRTLIKQGHPTVLAIHGFTPFDLERVTWRLLKSRLELGQSLEIEIAVSNPTTKSTALLIDARIGFLKSNGRLSPKVFKGKVFHLKPSETQKIRLRIPIRRVTTRRYYSGLQTICLLVNGQATAERSFFLKI